MCVVACGARMPPPRAAEAESHTCAICLEELALEDTDIATTPCRHHFHGACLDAWQEHGRRCPLCNADLPGAPRAETETHLRRSNSNPHPEETMVAVVCDIFTAAQCLFLDCMFVLFCLAVPALLFYAILYLGKAALWCISADHHHNHTIAIIVNATRVNVTRVNATRARHIDWSPDSVRFADFFMGVVVALMTALGVTICRICCCHRW